MTRIKICGITNHEDAKCAVCLGADALGFVFAPSPRKVDKSVARSICHSIPPFVNKVGVFTDQSVEEINAIVEYCGLDTIQLHGGNHADISHYFVIPIIRAFRVRGRETLGLIALLKPEYFLLDSYSPTQEGGTGKTCDWELACEARQYGNLILSGGLNPENVKHALENVRPYAVDVSSGVEKSPGNKDHRKMQLFIKEVRNCDNLTS